MNAKPYLGHWRITSMEAWDQEYVDAVRQAEIQEALAGPRRFPAKPTRFERDARCVF